MTRLAFLPFLAFVLVVFLVAGEAIGLESGFAPIQISLVAAHTFCFAMLARIQESILVVNEMQCLPALLFMAALAFLAQRALVFVSFGMTAIASLLHFPISDAREMAVPATNLFGRVSALQFNTSLFAVVEVFCVDLDQRDIAPLMFVVAFPAFILPSMPTMQAMLVELVLRNFPVTALAQARLGGLVEVFMTA
jgi:hypothetical protein